MTRFIWRLLTTLLSLAFLAMLLIITPLGLRITLPLVNHFSQRVHIDTEGVSGTLLGPIRVKNIIVSQSNNQYQATNAALQWQVAPLLLGQVKIKALTADHVHLFFGKNNPPSTSDRFVPISIQRFAINTITVVSPLRAQALRLSHLYGSALVHKKSVAINIHSHVELPGIQRANIHLNGSMRHYAFSVRFIGRNTHALFKGNGDHKHLSATITPSQLFHGSIAGTLQLTWKPTWQWDTKLSLTNVHLNEWDKVLPAVSSANIQSHGYIDTDKQPHIDYDANVVSDTITLKSQGHIARNKHFTWSLKASDLHSLSTSLPSGELQSTGAWNDGHSTGKLSATHLNWKGNSFGSLKTTWDFVGAPFHINRLSLQATDFAYSLLTIKKADVSVAGDQHHAHVTGHIMPDFPHWGLGESDFALEASRENGNHWNGRWEYFNLNGPHGLWTLGAHPQVSISGDGIKQPHMCWALNHRALCFHWSWLDSRWELHFQGQNLPLDTWLSLSLPHIQPVGDNHLTLNLSGSGNDPVQADASLQLDNNTMEFPAPYHPIAIPSGHFKSTLTNDGWMIDGSAKLEKNGHLTVHSMVDRTPNKTWGSRPLHASVTLDSDDFSPLLHLIPMLRLSHNTIQSHCLLTGSIGAPKFNGHLSLSNAEATLPSLGADLKGLDVETHWKNNHVAYELSSQPGYTPLSIKGTGDLDTQAWTFSTQAAVKGKHILIFNQPDYVVYADPDLTASLIGHDWSLDGKLTLSNTTLRPTSLASSHTVPTDVMVIRTGKTKEQHEHLGLNLQLKIANDVTIDTAVFKAALSGEIHLNKKPGLHPFLGNGSISMHDGRVDILTNHYFVNDASFTYEDTPITEPSLNVKIFRVIKGSRLRRKPKTRTVGLHITGPLRYPVILPYSSDPTLTNNDIVSYFAFDRPSDRGQPIHVAALLNALAELPNNGGNLDPKTRSMLIKQAIGFSELGEQSGASLVANTGAPISGNDDAFVVGRYLSPNIYLRYTRGITSAYSIYQVRYNLSPSLAIQTESGTLGNGGDLLYSFTSLLHPKTSALTK